MEAQQWWNASTVLAVVAICTTIIIGWANLKKDSRWHSKWIEKHSDERREENKESARREEEVTRVLEELRISITRVVTLVEGHHETIKGHDEEIKKIREKLHELGNVIHNRMHRQT